MNPFLAIFAWPIIVIILFQRHRAALALLISVIAGYLLLPEKTALDLPLLPALDKNTIPILASFLIAILLLPRIKSETHLPAWVPKNWIIRILMLALVASEFITAIANSDPLVYGPNIFVG